MVSMLVITFFISFVLVIITLIIIRRKKEKKYKGIIGDLDIQKNQLLGAAIMSELSKVKELVKTDNLQLKLDEWDKEFNQIKDEKLSNLTDMITEADFFIDKKDYKMAVKKITVIELEINELRKKSKVLLEEIKIITKSEERNRGLVTKLKMIYREMKSKYNRTIKDYNGVTDEIEQEFSKIDLKFKNFEKAMEANDYVSVEAIVTDLENDVNKMKDILDNLPGVILMASILVPSRIDEAQTLYYRMLRDGYPLDFLNVEYNLKEIKNKLEDIKIRIKKFDIKSTEVELKTIIEYFNNLYNDFEKEKEYKSVFKLTMKDFKNRLDELNKVVYDIFLQIDDIKKSYDLTEEEINKFTLINKSLEQMNKDYNILVDHSKGKTFAYSVLVQELNGLGKKLGRLQEDLDFRLRSISNMKDDETRAKEQYEMIDKLLRETKNRLKLSNVPVIPNSYFVQLQEAGDAIREVVKELNKKPIVIKILNIRVDNARDLVFKIYNKTNNMIKAVQESENLLVYANRFRGESLETDSFLDNARDLFIKGNYEESISLIEKKLNNIQNKD